LLGVDKVPRANKARPILNRDLKVIAQHPLTAGQCLGNLSFFERPKGVPVSSNIGNHRSICFGLNALSNQSGARILSGRIVSNWADNSAGSAQSTLVEYR
jgi:hypothetical protein